MLKRIFFICLIALGSSLTFGQTDSTDLTFYWNEPLIVTPLDSILYEDEAFHQLKLDFDVSDTLIFSKVCVELKGGEANKLLFIRRYDAADLTTEALMNDEWEVSIPFGNLEDTYSYTVFVTLENYAGALGSKISKTLAP